MSSSIVPALAYPLLYIDAIVIRTIYPIQGGHMVNILRHWVGQWINSPHPEICAIHTWCRLGLYVDVQLAPSIVCVLVLIGQTEN